MQPVEPPSPIEAPVEPRKAKTAWYQKLGVSAVHHRVL